MPLRIRQTAEGATLKVKVTAGAGRDAILGSFGDALKLSVRQAPERGKANRQVARLIAEVLGVRPGEIEVVRGAGSRDKFLLVRGADADGVAKKLVTYDRS